MNREDAKKRVEDKINHGFTTHRVMNRLLIEMGNEIVDTLFDYLEEQKNERLEAKAASRSASTKDLKQANG